MNTKQRLEQDLKTALLAGDKFIVTTIKGLKSAIINAEIAKGAQESGLSEDDITDLLFKEAKKRQESAELYKKGNNQQRADEELKEKKLIEKYLPKQMSEKEICQIVNKIIQENGWKGMQFMGQLMSAVKQKTQNSADSATIARLARGELEN